MNARQRRHARRHPLLVTTWDPNATGFKQLPLTGHPSRFFDGFAHRVAETMAGEAREVKRIPKWKRLAMLLGLSSALLGCAAKAPARRQFATPEHTTIRLKERCPLTPDGHLDKKHCVLMVRIDATEVGE